jgi:death-on-curing protein
MRYLSKEDVIYIHEQVIEPHEMQGLAPDKSIDAILDRISNRMQYGMITDVYELAACYGVYIAVGHAFNDANKRTGFQSMDLVMVLNGIELSYDAAIAGDKIIHSVLGKIDETDLAKWLREQTFCES